MRHTNNSTNMIISCFKFFKRWILPWKPSRGCSTLLGKVPIINLCRCAGELVESTVKYLASVENSLKLAVAVNLARLVLCYAFFTQFHEVSYPLKQGPGSLLELGLIPWTLPQMSAQHTPLGEARNAKFKEILWAFEAFSLHRYCFCTSLQEELENYHFPFKSQHCRKFFKNYFYL